MKQTPAFPSSQPRSSYCELLAARRSRAGLLLLLLLAAAKEAADVAASALDAVGSRAGDGLAAVGDATGGGVDGAGARDGGRDVAALVVLALTLGAVDALLGGEVADGLKEAALADLAGCEVVDAVLEGVDLFDAGHLGLAEGVWKFTS